MVTTRSAKKNAKPAQVSETTMRSTEQDPSYTENQDDGSAYEEVPEPDHTTSSSAPLIPAPVRQPCERTPEYRAALMSYHEEQVEWLIKTRDNNQPDDDGTHSTTSGPLKWNEIARLYQQRYGGEKVISQQAVSKRYLKHKEKFLEDHPEYPRSIQYGASRSQKRKTRRVVDDGEEEEEEEPRATKRVRTNREGDFHADPVSQPVHAPESNAGPSTLNPSEQYDYSIFNRQQMPLQDAFNVEAPGLNIQRGLGWNQSTDDSFQNPVLIPNNQCETSFLDGNIDFNDWRNDQLINNVPGSGVWGLESHNIFEPPFEASNYIPTSVPHLASNENMRYVAVTVINDEFENLGTVHIPVFQLNDRVPWLRHQQWTLNSTEINFTVNAERLLAVERYALCLDASFSQSRTLPNIDINMAGCINIQWTVEDLVELYLVATQFSDEEIKDRILCMWKSMLTTTDGMEICRHAINKLYAGTRPDPMGVDDRARWFWSEVIYCAGLSNDVLAHGGEDVHDELSRDLRQLAAEGLGMPSPVELDDETFADRFMWFENASVAEETYRPEIDYYILAARLIAAQGWYDSNITPVIESILRDTHYRAMSLNI